jgi:hypothetical protein
MTNRELWKVTNESIERQMRGDKDAPKQKQDKVHIITYIDKLLFVRKS